MATTITRAFDPVEDLPVWARRDARVVALARRDLAFRCDIAAARTKQYRQFLMREAARLIRDEPEEARR